MSGSRLISRIERIEKQKGYANKMAVLDGVEFPLSLLPDILKAIDGKTAGLPSPKGIFV